MKLICLLVVHIFLTITANELCNEGKFPLRLLIFLPCSTRHSIKHCDKHTLSAVEYAVARVNEDKDTLNCFNVELLPLHVANPNKDPTEVFNLLYTMYNNYSIHGVIGPLHTNTAQLFGYVFGNHLSKLQISYSLTDPLLNDATKYPYSYTTVPTDTFIVTVIAKLLQNFGWNRVGILSSDSTHYATIAYQLYKELRTSSTYLGSYITNPNQLLNLATTEDIKIFIAIVQEDLSRSLLCQGYHKGLTTENHVWILLGIHNPQWWYSTNNYTLYDNCTNEQILTAINSTLFVDVLPISLQTSEEQEINDVLSYVFNKTNVYNGESFSLDNIELHYLLHSKLLNAYDATNVLMLTWNNTIAKYNKFEQLYDILNQLWTNLTESNQMFVKTLQENLENVISPYQGLSGTYVFNKNYSEHGAALITQFQSTGECILGFYQTTNNRSLSSLKTCQLIECCNASWKGGYLPDDGICTNGTCVCRIFTNATQNAMIILLIMNIIGIIASIPLQFVNYKLKNNKYFKGSSPIFNAVITLGCLLEYICGILYITSYYTGITGTDAINHTVVCNFTFSMFWLSMVLINATIFMKNWRLFRIFFNPSQKQRDNLSNINITLGICLLVLPALVAVITIIIFNHFQPILYQFPYDCPNIVADNTYLIEDHCVERIGSSWDAFISIYILSLFIGIFVLGCFNCRIPSHYKQEGELAILTSFISLILFVIYYVLGLSLTRGFQSTSKISNHMPLVVGAIWLYASFILTVLYLPKVISNFRDKKRNKAPPRRSTVRKRLVSMYDQVFRLKNSLEIINSTIRSIENESN